MKLQIILIFLLALLSCESPSTTGIEYRSMLDVTAKVEIYQADESGKILLETIYIQPLASTLVELPAGETWTEYTPEGCFRVLPKSINLEEGDVYQDSLWFQLPLIMYWN